MTLKDRTPGGLGEGTDMAVVADRAFVRAQEALEAAKPKVEVPDITEDCDLDELLAWGRAVAERGGITPARSRELLAMVRQVTDDKAGH